MFFFPGKLLSKINLIIAKWKIFTYTRINGGIRHVDANTYTCMIDLIQRYRDNNKKIRLAAIIESAVCRWGEEEGEEEEENGEEEN